MTNHEEPGVYYSSIEEQFLARDGVDLRRSLTRPGLAFHGGIFALLGKTGLVVRIGADDAAAAIAEGRGLPYRGNESQVLAEWLVVPFDSTEPHRWAEWVDRAYQHARQRHPKENA